MISTLFLSLALVGTSPPDAGKTASVGIPLKIESLVLPGTELEVKPIDDVKTPIIVRIAEVYPHGSGFRYDLVFYGLEPGDYDLKNFLRRKDRSSLDGVPSIPVGITSVLPPGQIEPNQLKVGRTAWFGGYRLILLLGAMLWSAGLVGILYLTRRKPSEDPLASMPPATLADRLEPLVESAVAGTLGPEKYAELERLLIGYWLRRTGLQDADHAIALARLRNHEEAGPVIKQLEIWLHRPGGADEVDVPELLRPYRNIPAEAVEPVEVGAS